MTPVKIPASSLCGKGQRTFKLRKLVSERYVTCCLPSHQVGWPPALTTIRLPGGLPPSLRLNQQQPVRILGDFYSSQLRSYTDRCCNLRSGLFYLPDMRRSQSRGVWITSLNEAGMEVKLPFVESHHGPVVQRNPLSLWKLMFSFNS